VQAYDASGNELWTNQFAGSGGIYTPVQTNAYAVSAAPDGVYLAGDTSGTLPGQTYAPNGGGFVGKYDLHGNGLWAHEQEDWYLPRVRSTANGVVVVGDALTPNNPTNNTASVSQFDSNGNLVAVSQLTSVLSPQAVDATAGLVYVAGSFYGLPVPYYNKAFLAMLTPEPSTARPVSSVSSLPATETATNFPVHWSGSDGGGPGIIDYTIYVSDNGGPFTSWTRTSSKNQNFADKLGHTYGFYSIARDWAGNQEPAKTAPEATTQVVDLTKPVSHVTALPPTEPPSFLVQWSGTDTGGPGIASYSIYYSDNGGAFTEWLKNRAITQATFSGTDGHTYGFYSIARDRFGIVEASKSAAEATTLVQGP